MGHDSIIDSSNSYIEGNITLVSEVTNGTLYYFLIMIESCYPGPPILYDMLITPRSKPDNILSFFNITNYLTWIHCADRTYCSLPDQYQIAIQFDNQETALSFSKAINEAWFEIMYTDYEANKKQSIQEGLRLPSYDHLDETITRPLEHLATDTNPCPIHSKPVTISPKEIQNNSPIPALEQSPAYTEVK